MWGGGACYGEQVSIAGLDLNCVPCLTNLNKMVITLVPRHSMDFLTSVDYLLMKLPVFATHSLLFLAEM